MEGTTKKCPKAAQRKQAVQVTLSLGLVDKAPSHDDTTKLQWFYRKVEHNYL